MAWGVGVRGGVGEVLKSIKKRITNCQRSGS